MKFYKPILTGLCLIMMLAVFGQELKKDPIDIDLENLTDIDFYKKYSFEKAFSSKTDLIMTRRVWSTKHLRKADKEIRTKDVKTFTVVEQKPSKGNTYYIIGYYQLPTDDHLMRMSFYRLDIKNGTIEYQALGDLTEDKWTKVE